MFLMDYADGEWQNARIVPYGPLDRRAGVKIFPGSVALNYAQSGFEGAKAFEHPDGELHGFRLDQNARRLNKTAARLCMPEIPETDFLEGITALLDVDRLWFPQREEHSLYIRPVLFGNDDSVGVSPSSRYVFVAFLSPSGPYFKGGFGHMLKLAISMEHHRAAPGGTGAVKAAVNYAGSMLPGKLMRERFGAAQVLYLDVTNSSLEETGSTNHYHVVGDTLVIPEFTDTILESITARSVLERIAAGDIHGLRAENRRVSLEEFIDGLRSKRISEAGVLGTAAVVTPGCDYVLPDGKSATVGNGRIGPHSRTLYQLLTDIQTGVREAPEGWLQHVERRAQRRHSRKAKRALIA